MSLLNKEPSQMSAGELAEVLAEIQPHVRDAIVQPEAIGFNRDAMNLHRIARTVGRSAAEAAAIEMKSSDI